MSTLCNFVCFAYLPSEEAPELLRKCCEIGGEIKRVSTLLKSWKRVVLRSKKIKYLRCDKVALFSVYFFIK
ncbi:unnamed protein product [Heterobilharzia americana]|nr:unnamed protein product [Heterobilharzia americana]